MVVVVVGVVFVVAVFAVAVAVAVAFVRRRLRPRRRPRRCLRGRGCGPPRPSFGSSGGAGVLGSRVQRETILAAACEAWETLERLRARLAQHEAGKPLPEAATVLLMSLTPSGDAPERAP